MISETNADSTSVKNHSSNTNPLFSYASETECFSIWYSKHALGKHWNRCSEMFGAILVQRGMICQGQCITPPISRACMCLRIRHNKHLRVRIRSHMFCAHPICAWSHIDLQGAFCWKRQRPMAVRGGRNKSRLHRIFSTDNPSESLLALGRTRTCLQTHIASEHGYQGHEKQLCHSTIRIISNRWLPYPSHQPARATHRANQSNFDTHASLYKCTCARANLNVIWQINTPLNNLWSPESSSLAFDPDDRSGLECFILPWALCIRTLFKMAFIRLFVSRGLAFA